MYVLYDVLLGLRGYMYPGINLKIRKMLCIPAVVVCAVVYMCVCVCVCVRKCVRTVFLLNDISNDMKLIRDVFLSEITERVVKSQHNFAVSS